MYPDYLKGDADESARHIAQIFLMLKMAGKIFERNKKWSDFHRIL
jgi:hypothetical protein